MLSVPLLKNRPMKRLLIYMSVVSLFGIVGFSPAFAKQDGTLHIEKDNPKIITLEKAVANALLKNPTLSAHSLEKRVREARTLQSGLLPNPRLEVNVNDVVVDDVSNIISDNLYPKASSASSIIYFAV